MISHRAYTLSLLCLVVSCVVPANPQINASPPLPETVNAVPKVGSVNTDIRPGPNGPKLELVTLEGELLIPTGTSAFVVQGATQISLVSQMMRVLSPPAYAAVSEDEDIEAEDIQAFTASVNGQIVPMTVLDRVETDAGQVISYRLEQVPTSDNNVMLEFKSPSNAFVIRGLVEKIEKTTTRLSERFDLDSTALAYLWESLGDARPERLNQDNLNLLKKQSSVQEVKQALYQHYIRPEMKSAQQAQAVRNVLSPVLNQALQKDTAAQTYLKKVRACQQTTVPCGLPALQDRQVQELPPVLVRLAELREAARKKKRESRSRPSKRAEVSAPANSALSVNNDNQKRPRLR